MTDSKPADILLTDIIVNPEPDAELGQGYLAFLGFQPLTSFPPYAGLPPAKYYTGGWAKTKEEAVNKVIDIVVEHLIKLKT